MPRLLERDDLMRMAVDLGRAQEVWATDYDSASGEFNFSLPHGGSYQIVVMRVSRPKQGKADKRKPSFGLMKEKLKNWNYEADRAMDEEICEMFDCLKKPE